jgi:uroporphyrinogen decarboxylase
MTNRERIKHVLHYEKYDRLPIVHFGYWYETLVKWANEGHITQEQAKGWGDGNTIDVAISKNLGFDCDWSCQFGGHSNLSPAFESKVIREFPDGSRHVMNGEGVIELDVPGAVSIKSEIEHTLKDRASWEEHYKPRLQWSEQRITDAWVRVSDDNALQWKNGAWSGSREMSGISSWGSGAARSMAASATSSGSRTRRIC